MLRETEIVLKLHDIIANYCREKDIDYIVGGLFLKIFLERVNACFLQIFSIFVMNMEF